MTKNTNKLASIRAILPLCGFSKDAYGHYQKNVVGRALDGSPVPAKMRVKIQDISARIELKRNAPGAEWNKIGGAYLKDIIVESDSVTIGRKKFTVE